MIEEAELPAAINVLIALVHRRGPAPLIGVRRNTWSDATPRFLEQI
jgi:hypothetical protein